MTYTYVKYGGVTVWGIKRVASNHIFLMPFYDSQYLLFLFTRTHIDQTRVPIDLVVRSARS